MAKVPVTFRVFAPDGDPESVCLIEGVIAHG